MKDKNEKGIALILTLGILSFLLVLALGFASSAIVQKKAAANSANFTLARILAESAVEKCIAGLAFYTDNMPTAAFDLVFSQETDDPRGNNKTYDTLYRLTTTQNGITYYEWPSNYDKNSSDAIHWQYVYNGESGANERIIGRYAYVVLPSGGKLNPGYCVSHTSTYPDGTARDESTSNETRAGKNLNEIRIGKLIPSPSSAYIDNTDLQKLSTTAAGCGGLLTDGGVWIDTDSMITTVLGAGNETKKMYWNDWFAVNNTADPERFWIDINNDKLQNTATEFFHRFNIARTDWNAADKVQFMNDYILNNPTTWTTTDNDGTSIPWIKYWGESSGGWPDAATKAKQIAANIIDYCDSDDIPTTDLDADGNLTFMGLDRTPYINEIGIRVECTTTVSNAGGGNYNFDYTIKVYLGGERIDMYSGMPGGAAKLTIRSGNIQYTYRKPDGSNETVTQSIASNVDISAPGAPPAYSFTWSASTIDFNHNPGPGASNSAQLSNVKVQILKAQLEWPAGTVVDFVQPDGSSDWSQSVDFATVTGVGASTENAYFSYQVDDPRHNLHNSDWDQATGQIAADYNAAGGTQGTINSSKVTCTTSGDAEPGSTPTSISTAYIRNAPMQSPWELGFIHRAAKWETLNLKKYNSDDNDNGTVDSGEYGVSNNFGGRAYAKGDANILDQVKMHSFHSIPGKINIRAPQSVDILRALLADIKVGDLPSSFTGGTALTYTSSPSSQVPALANAIFGSSARPFLTRAQVAKVSALSDASIVSAQNTDAKKEEIIGKFINLTKTDPADEFLVIVLAQAIKDTGVPSPNEVTIRKDLDYNGTIGTANETIAGFDIDGDGKISSSSISETINAQFARYDQYADEILAEQKIIVRVKYDSSAPTGAKWRIARFEYIEN